MCCIKINKYLTLLLLTFNSSLMETLYVSPDMYILDIVPEGMMCSSNEMLEENEGEW